MATLYEINQRYLAALEFLTDPDNDIDAQTLTDTMDGIEGELADKVLNVARFVVQIEHDAEGIEAAARRMKERGKTLENKAARLREYINTHMQTAGLPKASAPDLAVSLAKLPASVHIDDEALIPPEFWREKVERSIDKSAIKAVGGCPGARVESVGFRVAIR